jgi:hypothetical protein
MIGRTTLISESRVEFTNAIIFRANGVCLGVPRSGLAI